MLTEAETERAKARAWDAVMDLALGIPHMHIVANVMQANLRAQEGLVIVERSRGATTAAAYIDAIHAASAHIRRGVAEANSAELVEPDHA